PIAEQGGLNLYGFVGNKGVMTVDVLGLQNVQVIGEHSWNAWNALPESRRKQFEEAVKASGEDFYIVDGKDNMHYPDDNKITLNGKSVPYDTKEGVGTGTADPEFILGHEMDHAVRTLNDPDKANELRGTRSENYGYMLEQEAIK